MMRLLATLSLALVVAVSFSGCTSITPMNGSLYTDVQGPVAVGSATGSSKVGEAKATSIVGVALGDCSISTAMKNGGITKVHHVDTKVRNILGVYAEYTTIVYGE
ncbi:MAG TPA: TRL-like family protein [Planctomycetota bacterium]|nr:TRL-like family protein [Planctomycetota bacterium]